MNGAGDESEVGDVTEDDAEQMLMGGPSRHLAALDNVAQLLATARGPAVGDERVGREDFLRAFASAEPLVTDRRPSRRPARRRYGLILVGGGLAMLTASAAAAATGSLPDAIQRPVAVVASRAGINLPSPDDAHADTSTTDPGTPPSDRPVALGGGSGGTTAHATGPTGTGSVEASESRTPIADASTEPIGQARTTPSSAATARLVGLCRAYEASGRPKQLTSPAFRELVDAATEAGQSVLQFCSSAQGSTPAPAPTSSVAIASGTTPSGTIPEPTATTAGTPGPSSAAANGNGNGHAGSSDGTRSNGNAGGNGNGNAGGHGNGNDSTATTATTSHGKP